MNLFGLFDLEMFFYSLLIFEFIKIENMFYLKDKIIFKVI